jgi:hypothetical protein
MSSSLRGLVIIEKDINEDLISWSFPSISEKTDQALKARCGLKNESIQSNFLISKLDTQWQYMLNAPIVEEGSKLTGVCVCILSDAYNPIKFNDLCTLLLKEYLTTKTSIPALQAYLNVYSKGKASCGDNGAFDDASYDPRRALIAPVHELLLAYGIEAIVIWVAVLSKKRIFVYHDKASDVIAAVRSILLLGGWHRQNFSVLRPLCTTSDTEMQDIGALPHVVAGFTNPDVQSMTNNYDLFLDIPNKSFIIPDHAKKDFVMTKFHKQASESFLKSAEGKNDQAVIKAVAVKTKELIDQLTALKGEYPDGKYIKFADIQNWTKELPPNMVNDTFLYNVAAAEGMCK